MFIRVNYYMVDTYMLYLFPKGRWGCYKIVTNGESLYFLDEILAFLYFEVVLTQSFWINMDLNSPIWQEYTSLHWL